MEQLGTYVTIESFLSLASYILCILLLETSSQRDHTNFVKITTCKS